MQSKWVRPNKFLFLQRSKNKINILEFRKISTRSDRWQIFWKINSRCKTASFQKARQSFRAILQRSDPICERLHRWRKTDDKAESLRLPKSRYLKYCLEVYDECYRERINFKSYIWILVVTARYSRFWWALKWRVEHS